VQDFSIKEQSKVNLKNPDITPKVFRVIPVSYAIKECVEFEIIRLVSTGILSPVDYSDWCTPVVL
ncbi:hypothetical protein HHI36_003028, partial [Cryptolaemus montrouzieri]